MRPARAHLAAVDDHVDLALGKQELGALEALGELFTHGLLDDARARKAHEGLGFGDHDVAHESERGGDAAHRRVGEHRNEGEPGLVQTRDGGRRLGHLHEGEKALLLSLIHI